MSGIGVVTNPLSRKNRRDPRLATRLAYILGERGEVQQPSDLDALLETARLFKRREIDVLCVNGGDGTLHRVLTAMVKAYDGAPLPKVAMLRGGTMNTLASGMGIKGTPAEILNYVVSRYHADEPMPVTRRWLMDINHEQYGFLFGTGLAAHFLEAYYEGDPTPRRAVWLLIRGVFSTLIGGSFVKRLFRPFHADIIADDTRWPRTEWISVAAGTADDIGLGFRPFYKCLLYPGRMHAVGFGCSAWEFIKELPRMFRAHDLAAEDNVGQVCELLTVRSPADIGYMIDGDFHRTGQEIQVSMGPPVDFIVPVP